MLCSQVSVSQVQEIREEVDNYIENSQVVQLWNHAVTVICQFCILPYLPIGAWVLRERVHLR